MIKDYVPVDPGLETITVVSGQILTNSVALSRSGKTVLWKEHAGRGKA
jgi:sugar lactone lactonase YvrE